MFGSILGSEVSIHLSQLPDTVKITACNRLSWLEKIVLHLVTCAFRVSLSSYLLEKKVVGCKETFHVDVCGAEITPCKRFLYHAVKLLQDLMLLQQSNKLVPLI